MVMVNCVCAFSQSELGKYFEWIIKTINVMAKIIFEFIIEVFHLSILHLIAYFETTRRQQYDV